MARAKPMFRGHYQPHIPADLGFYDLRVPETREAQAEMAREHAFATVVCHKNKSLRVFLTLNGD